MAPLGVVATSRAISDFFDDHFFAHGHTYEAHPLTLAPAIAAIDEYKRMDLINRTRTVGEGFGARLRDMASRHKSVGEVRGLGLFWAIDLVKNRDTREPFNTPQEKAARKPLLIDQITGDLMKRGVSCVGWVSHLVLAPPLIIDDAQLDEALVALDAALTIADAAAE
jgi:taurine--2-oxoglutarate transaminase